MKKKVLCMILGITMTEALAGCSGKTDHTDSTGKTETQEESLAAEKAEPLGKYNEPVT